MKKKIVYIILCLISLFVCSDIKAESRACTQEEIANARATLTSGNPVIVPIPTLGRTDEKARIYKMFLTNDLNGSIDSSFCLDSAKHAPTGIQYKIHHRVNSNYWLAAYQYGISHKVENGLSEGYIAAQAALWILREGKSWWDGTDSDNIEDQLLYKVIKEIDLSYRCETYLKMYPAPGDTKDTCSSLINLGGPYAVYEELYTRWKSKQANSLNTTKSQFERVVLAGVKAEYNSLKTASKDGPFYNGNLYYWVPVSGDYQGMLAPLDCDGTTDKNYFCTDKSGVKHDYTDEYNACILGGKNRIVCKSELNNKYCPGGTTIENKYIVKRTGNDAVCASTTTNVGTYYEYVEESTEGTAIPGKGDSESEIQINRYCNLYCLENSAQQVFPGNIRTAVSVGTYIIWPTSESTLSSKYKNYYPLSFNGQKTCYVVMSGENNPINNIPLTTYYNNLVSSIPNNAYGSYAKKTYDQSRQSEGGCDSVYGEACKTLNDAVATAKKAYDDYINSKEYNDAVKSKNAKDEANAKVYTCNNNKNSAKETCQTSYNNEIKNYCKTTKCCENAKTTCLSNCFHTCPNCSNVCYGTCNHNYYQCTSRQSTATKNYNDCIEKANTDYNCGSYQETSSDEAAIKKATELKDAYDEAVKNASACNAQHTACNNYTDKVNELIEFSKQLKTCATYTPSCSGTSCDIYKYSTNVDLSWSDSDYGTIITDSQLEKSTNYYLEISNNNNTFVNVSSDSAIATIKQNAKKLIDQVQNVTNNRQIKANVNVTYSLPTTNLLYNYVVAYNDSTKAQTKTPSSDSNYSTIGFSNLPISYKALTNVSYELKLSNIKFGDNGQYSPNDYTCNYKVTKTPSDDCLCDGSKDKKYAGIDMSSHMIEENLTCEEAKEKYCKGRPTDPYSCPDGSKTNKMTSCMQENDDYNRCVAQYCKTEDKFCPNNPTISLMSCLNTHNDYNYCYNILCTLSCTDPPCAPYICSNKNGVDGYMDITSCVDTKISQGLSKNAAINTCDSILCPLSGLRIIYRTISLENPFPSKTADAIITQDGLTIGMFNDDVKGRYPGTNWNDQKLVQNHILTVTRNKTKIDGSNIYQSEPLYRFELNTATINAIRDYNEKREENGGYDDFTLECRLGNSKACVSEKFVHNQELSGLVSGLCMNSTNKTNFYQCSGDD